MSANSFLQTPKVVPKKEPKNKFSSDEKGLITNTLGTGDNAKNSLVYICVRWCFFAAIGLSLLVVINNWVFRVNEKVPTITDDLRVVWNIFIPLVTLALGYAFGKSQK
jgi:hypothetical protein